MNQIRTIVAMAVATVLAGTMLAFAPASNASTSSAPTTERSRAFYGAIALSADSTIAYSYDYRTKRRALRAAYRKCKARAEYPGTCTKVGWVRNGCGAVAVKYGTNGLVSRYKFGWGRTKAIAKANARRNFGGQIRGWVCTTRR